MYQRILAAIAAELSGARAKREIREIFLRDRIGTTPAFNQTGEHVFQRLTALKLKEVQKYYYTADGKTRISDWRPSPAWDCKAAYLKILAPAELAGTVVCRWCTWSVCVGPP